MAHERTFLDGAGHQDTPRLLGVGAALRLETRILVHPRLAEERYNETHGCNDIWGTAERCFKNCDGHVMEIQDLVP